MLQWKPHTSQVASHLSARRPLQSDMARFQSQWWNLCCNPFNKPHHFIRKKSQLVTKRMCEKVPSFLPGEICDSCRKKLAAESEWQSLPQEHSYTVKTRWLFWQSTWLLELWNYHHKNIFKTSPLLSQLHNIAWYGLELKDEYVQFLLTIKHINKRGGLECQLEVNIKSRFKKGRIGISLGHEYPISWGNLKQVWKTWISRLDMG